MAKRYCGNCGNEIRPDDRFCPACGKPAHETAVLPTPEAHVPKPPPPEPPLGEETVVAEERVSPNLVPAFTLASVLAFAAFVLVAGPLEDGSRPLALGAAALVWLVVFAFRLNKTPTTTPQQPGVRLPSRTPPQWVKIAVATRDGGTCRQCGSNYDLQYDHIIPYSRGGSSTDVNNIQLLCGRCNRRKSNRYVG